MLKVHDKRVVPSKLGEVDDLGRVTHLNVVRRGKAAGSEEVLEGVAADEGEYLVERREDVLGRLGGAVGGRVSVEGNGGHCG